MLDIRTEFSFCGNNYMIFKSKIEAANLGLFIISHAFLFTKQSIAHMPLCGPLCSLFDYLNIVEYKHNISMHGMYMMDHAYGNFKRKNLLYIHGRPPTHGKIEGFINGYTCSLFSANCLFKEHSNDKELFMKRKASRFTIVNAICSLSCDDQLLINYLFHRPLSSHQIQLALYYL
jgi:hypothetical protein